MQHNVHAQLSAQDIASVANRSVLFVCSKLTNIQLALRNVQMSYRTRMIIYHLLSPG